MRVWHASWRSLDVFIYFNSHTREGVTVTFIYGNFSIPISTHTPVRVWRFMKRIRTGWWLFQLTHPWGCDCGSYKSLLRPVAFQLTHPWGCDYGIVERGYKVGNFNSHTREGVTTEISMEFKEENFNSHTREGVTTDGLETMKKKAISTHTPVRVWLFSIWISCDLRHFNSHTREGVTAMKYS